MMFIYVGKYTHCFRTINIYSCPAFHLIGNKDGGFDLQNILLNEFHFNVLHFVHLCVCLVISERGCWANHELLIDTELFSTKLFSINRLLSNL